MDGVLDHADKTLVVAAGVAGETFDSVDFPAVAVFLGGGEDVDEAFLIREAVVLGRLSVCFTSTAAVVQLLLR